VVGGPRAPPTTHFLYEREKEVGWVELLKKRNKGVLKKKGCA
jgi:hypothetical protein